MHGRTVGDRPCPPRFEHPVPGRLREPPQLARRVHVGACVGVVELCVAVVVFSLVHLQSALDRSVQYPAHADQPEFGIVEEPASDVGVDAGKPHFLEALAVLAFRVGRYPILGIEPPVLVDGDGVPDVCHIGQAPGVRPAHIGPEEFQGLDGVENAQVLDQERRPAIMRPDRQRLGELVDAIPPLFAIEVRVLARLARIGPHGVGHEVFRSRAQQADPIEHSAQRAGGEGTAAEPEDEHLVAGLPGVHEIGVGLADVVSHPPSQRHAAEQRKALRESREGTRCRLRSDSGIVVEHLLLGVFQVRDLRDLEHIGDRLGFDLVLGAVEADQDVLAHSATLIVSWDHHSSSSSSFTVSSAPSFCARVFFVSSRSRSFAPSGTISR